MGSFAFWSPVLRAWLAALPYFIVGMSGILLQLERMRKSKNQTIKDEFTALKADLDDKLTKRQND